MSLAHLNEHGWEPLVPLFLPDMHVCLKNSSKDNNQVLFVNVQLFIPSAPFSASH